jgi:serine/threonine-protein kinase
MSDPSPDDGSPRVHLGRFELVHRLDIGGMAEIFLALERGLHDFERVVVIKRALPHLAEKASFREMFLQEARWVARLNHPNIVQIYELGEAEGTAFIAMEHVVGVSFRELVHRAAERGTPVPLGVVVGLMEQACAGAHAAHELTDGSGRLLGLVHRDISPHNLMVTAGGHVKLLDFGIAKATELGVDNTRPGALKGKVSYMSPEQVLQTRLDRRSDVFALGIVAWELLTLRRLFKREHELATMQAITGTVAARPERWCPGLPAAISEAVMQALSLDPEARFSTADGLRRALVAGADAAGVRHDADTVAAWVAETMGAQLTAQADALKVAVERAKKEGFSSDAPVPQRSSTASLLSRSDDAAPDATVAEPPPAEVGRRRLVLQLAAVGLLAVLLGAGAGYLMLRRPALSGPALRVGWAPTIDEQVLARDVEPLRRHLEARTHSPVEFIFAHSYHELAEQLLDGRVTYAAMPPALFVRTQLKDPRVRSLALKLVGGSSGSDGVLVTVDGSGIGALAELKGKTICIPDRDSTTGFLLPRIAVRRVGLDFERDATLVVSGNHLRVLRDLTEGRCQAGATYSSALLTAVTQGIDVSGLRQVAITGHTPQDTIVAGPMVPTAEAEALLQAVLSYRPPGEHVGAGTMERISGFVPSKPEDYASVRELVAAEAAGP